MLLAKFDTVSGDYINDIDWSEPGPYPPGCVPTTQVQGFWTPRLVNGTVVEGDPEKKQSNLRARAMASTVIEQQRIVAGGFDFEGAWLVREGLNVDETPYDVVPISTSTNALLELEQIAQAVAAKGEVPAVMRHEGRADLAVMCDAQLRPIIIETQQIVRLVDLAQQHLFNAKAAASQHLTQLIAAADPETVDTSQGWPDVDPQTRPVATLPELAPTRFPWLTETEQYGNELPKEPYPNQPYFYLAHNHLYRWDIATGLWLGDLTSFVIGLSGNVRRGKPLEAAGDVRFTGLRGYAMPYDVMVTDLHLRWDETVPASGHFSLTADSVMIGCAEFQDTNHAHGYNLGVVQAGESMGVKLSESTEVLRYVLGWFACRRFLCGDSPMPEPVEIPDDAVVIPE